MSVIAVVGATGTIGSRLVARLAARGHEVRAIAQNPGESGDGVEPFAADLTQADQALAALEGATGVYLTPPDLGRSSHRVRYGRTTGRLPERIG